MRRVRSSVRLPSSLHLRRLQVFDHRAIRRRPALKRLIAHPQVVTQRVAERVELLAARFHLCQLSCEEITNVAASRSPGVGLMTDQVANLSERQAVGLRLLDEADAIDGGAVVLAKPARRATRSRNDPLAPVVPKGIAGQTAGSGEFTNAQCSSRHDWDAFAELRRSTAAMTSPRQQAPRGFRISHAQRPAAMCKRTRWTASDWPRCSISAAMSASF